MNKNRNGMIEEFVQIVRIAAFIAALIMAVSILMALIGLHTLVIASVEDVAAISREIYATLLVMGAAAIIAVAAFMAQYRDRKVVLPVAVMALIGTVIYGVSGIMTQTFDMGVWASAGIIATTIAIILIKTDTMNTKLNLFRPSNNEGGVSG